MGDDGGQGLIIIGAVVIAFINWLSTTLKERAERRKAGRRPGETPAAQPEPVEEYRESWPEPEEEPVTGGSTAPQQLRDFFDSLAGKPPQPAPVAPPEPDRWEPPEVTRAELSAEERSALERLDGPSPIARKRRGRASGEHPLVAKLRTPGGARDAVLFAEILGKPKGLADHQPQP